MPWWVATYLILFAALCCAGVYHDISQSEPLWYTFADAGSAFCSLTAIWAYWHPPIAAALGALLFATTLYALIWDCFSMEHDLRSELPDPELSAKENRIINLVATVAVFSFTLPAYYFGFIAAYDHARAATPTA